MATKYKSIRDSISNLTGVITLVLMMAQPAHADAGVLSYADAITKAGRQRMLTQRITKSWCQFGLDVKTERSRRQLHDAIDLFSSQLQVLKKFSLETEAAHVLDDIEALWIPFREQALAVPGRQAVKPLLELEGKLLSANERLVRTLVDQSENSVTSLVNISGRQRMLSQRLAKFYLLKAWGQSTASINAEIDRARNEFSGALEVLIEAPENTLAIKEKLEQAKLQWAWFSSSLNFSNEEYFPLIVVDASEKLLAIMEDITEKYQMIANNSAR